MASHSKHQNLLSSRSIDLDYIEENDLDPDEGNRMLCKACALPIFSTPLYNGNIDFPLHKDCANLPMELKGHFLHPKEKLFLHKTRLPDQDGAIECVKCLTQCKGFVYRCSVPKCKYVIDVLCAVPIGTIKVHHRSHRHDLFPISAEAYFICHVCERLQGGPSYLCNECRFWIHWDCALAPNKIWHKKHDIGHILTLTDSRTMFIYSPFEVFDCAICGARIPRDSGFLYFCTRCEYYVHFKCAASDPESFSTALEGDSRLIHLPPADVHTSLVCYLLENTSTSSKSSEEDQEEEASKLFEGKHEHPLIYHGHMTSIIKDEDLEYHYLCNGCIKPISSPFYRCPQCTDFFLHSCCANLPLEYRKPAYNRRFPLVFRCETDHDDFISRLIECPGCNHYSNGFVYADRRYSFDAGCSFMPRSITHEAHPKSHILLLHSHIADILRSDIESCLCCGGIISGMSYRCIVCRHFNLHLNCAMLPKTVTHKFDKHPLKLIFTRSGSKSLLLTTKEDDAEKHFCEICENSINTDFWFYGCDECDNLFHIDCLPSVGRFSKVKFGGTVRVRSHDCPLTSIRLLTEFSHMCGICKDTIQGLVDEISFECAKCDFRVHRLCAEKKRVI